MHTDKKILTVLTVAALFCTGCSANTAPAVNTVSSDTVSDEVQSPEDTSDMEDAVKSVDEVYQEIEQTVSLKSPQCMDEEFILNYYGIDVTGLEEYVFSMSEDAAQAETVVIMKVKDSGDLEEFTNCLQTVVDDKKSEMEDYIPEQFAIVESSKVQTKDNYIWLIISENADEIADVIENGLF